jgi:hypothetical protein
MKLLKEYFKPETTLKIKYFKGGDMVIKQILDGNDIVYEQSLLSTSITEFTFDKICYNELYENETNIANGFMSIVDESGKCVIQ